VDSGRAAEAWLARRKRPAQTRNAHARTPARPHAHTHTPYTPKQHTHTHTQDAHAPTSRTLLTSTCRLERMESTGRSTPASRIMDSAASSSRATSQLWACACACACVRACVCVCMYVCCKSANRCKARKTAAPPPASRSLPLPSHPRTRPPPWPPSRRAARSTRSRCPCCGWGGPPSHPPHRRLGVGVHVHVVVDVGVGAEPHAARGRCPGGPLRPLPWRGGGV
jgi:hypothetical protein